MIRIEYDRTLLEQATFLGVRRDKRVDAEFHLAVDHLYEIEDKLQRERAFAPVFQEFFSKLQLDRTVADLLAERPLIRERVLLCVVREAPRAKDESAELFIKDTATTSEQVQHTLVIQACPQSLVEEGEFTGRLRRDLLHVHDMLDEQFGYRREGISGLRARQNLVRDRYSVLWEVYVEGRLAREGRGTDKAVQSLRHAFSRVFAGASEQAGCKAFDRVLGAASLTHQQLLEWAEEPEALLEEHAETAEPMRGAPGQRCPLCSFPTHDWFDLSTDVQGDLATKIRTAHTHWSPDSGVCRQCAELYANPAVKSTPAASAG